MTPADADALEARIAQNPDDWDTRERLVTYCRMGRAVPWEKKVPGPRRYALWLIEHHPEHDVQAPPLSPEYDPKGFAAERVAEFLESYARLNRIEHDRLLEDARNIREGRRPAAYEFMVTREASSR
jgi:hypothetical protein